VANIKQQKKRNRLAVKQRLRNRHSKSTLKTLFKQLETEVAEKKGDEAAKTAVFLTSRIDTGRKAPKDPGQTTRLIG
jgi:ribosomal protein S20